MNKKFDPEEAGQVNSNLFGFPYSESESEVVVIPVPWEVTASYGEGTADSPEALLKASPQIDFFDPDLADAWKYGIFMREIPVNWKEKNLGLRQKAVQCIAAIEKGKVIKKDKKLSAFRDEINEASGELNEWVKEQSLEIIKKGKLPCVLGGDHSSSLGLIQALSEKNDDFGILQIDAHADLREEYEGFTYSHASIMHHALKSESVSSLVQVGIRDLSPGEMKTIENDNRINAFFHQEMKRQQFEGKSWQEQVEDIINELPSFVYLSFDIDGLDPSLCPNTGTPVPGGLQVEEVNYLLFKLIGSGRKLIGFDLCEISPGDDDWDANVGSRMLYKLCNFLYASSS